MEKFFINEAIKSKKVVLINDDGKRIGEFYKDEAIKLSKERGFDLVQVSGDEKNASFPLCKMMDYGKMKYEKSKKQIQKAPKEKEIFFHLNTSQHDLETKKKHIKELLKKGVRVKFGIEMRKREKTFAEKARQALKQNVSDFEGMAKWDDIHGADRFLFINIIPL